MQRTELARIAAIYLPLAAAVMAGLLRSRQKRMFAACLLGTVWTLPTLLVLERINGVAHWWSFHPVGPALLGIPLELYLGWAILWGAAPILLLRRLNLPEVLILFGALDLWLMSYLEPLLYLHWPKWLWGEAAALALVLAPAYCLARWTLDDTHLKLRAALQVALSGLVFLFLLPEVAFALRPAAGMDSVWKPLFRMPQPMLATAVQIIAIAALPGVSAVMEFAQRGNGTPIPYDPPRRMVTSGIYRYCANPMQLSCAVVMFLWAMVLRNPWLMLAALVSAVTQRALHTGMRSAIWQGVMVLRGSNIARLCRCGGCAGSLTAQYLRRGFTLRAPAGSAVWCADGSRRSIRRGWSWWMPRRCRRVRYAGCAMTLPTARLPRKGCWPLRARSST